MRSCSGFSGQAKQLAISFMTRISLHWLPSMGSANSGPPIATSRGFLEFMFEIRSISKADRRGSLALFGCISLHSYVAAYPFAISPATASSSLRPSASTVSTVKSSPRSRPPSKPCARKFNRMNDSFVAQVSRIQFCGFQRSMD